MKDARSTSRVIRWGLVVCAGLAAAVLLVLLQDRIDAGRSYQDPDLLYFASPAAVKKLAMGYDGLLADAYWIRTVQYYGRREEAERRRVPFKNLFALLDITLTLDPRMMDVYHAGHIFLSEPEPLGAGQPEHALELLDKGIARHPDQWRLFLDKGFVYFWYLKEYRRAGRVWLEAARIPGAPPWLEPLAATALSKGGAIEAAKMLWKQQYEQSPRADLRENALNHLNSMRVDEDLMILEFFLEEFRTRRGTYPPGLNDLVREGLLKVVPRDPSGTPYQYDPSTGEVKLGEKSGIRYLKMPVEFHQALEKQLAERLSQYRPAK